MRQNVKIMYEILKKYDSNELYRLVNVSKYNTGSGRADLITSICAARQGGRDTQLLSTHPPALFQLYACTATAMCTRNKARNSGAKDLCREILRDCYRTFELLLLVMTGHVTLVKLQVNIQANQINTSKNMKQYIYEVRNETEKLWK